LNEKNFITTNSISIVAAVSVSLLLLSFVVLQTMTIVNVDAAKTSREKACTNPRNTQEKDPKFCAHLIVIKNVAGSGTASPSDFTISIVGNNPSPSSFPGSSSGTTVTLGEGNFRVEEGGPAYDPSFVGDCTSTMSAGQTKTCTITNTFIP
jgi:hypothetical protein